MRNITEQIKEAISINALWSISDFFYFLEKLQEGGFETSFWNGEENWATFSLNGTLLGYVWQKYPLVFIKHDYLNSIKAILLNELDYVVFIESEDLYSNEFVMNMDNDLILRLGNSINAKSFSANELWFKTVTI